MHDLDLKLVTPKSSYRLSKSDIQINPRQEQWRWMTSYLYEAQMFQGDTLVPGGRTHTIPLKENPEVCVQCLPWLRRDHESCPSLQGVLEWVRTSQLPRPPPLPPAHQPPPQDPLYSYKVNTHTHSIDWNSLAQLGLTAILLPRECTSSHWHRAFLTYTQKVKDL